MQSLFTLTKYNNGLFKSKKHKAYLMSQCQEDNKIYSGGGNLYGNWFRHVFTFDDLGIVKVEKITRRNARLVWRRLNDEEYNIYKKEVADKSAKIHRLNRMHEMVETWNHRLETYKRTKILAVITAGKYVAEEELLKKRAGVVRSIERKIDVIWKEIERADIR